MEEGYFVFDKGMSEVARAVADDQPDKSGLQQLLLGAQSCKHLNATVVAVSGGDGCPHIVCKILRVVDLKIAHSS